MKIKPSARKHDVKRWFSVVVIAYNSWGDDDADE